jgi:glycosyltransferase involved in cell wall biosynthesis
MRRTLLICDYPPATYAGGPIILHNLFKGFPKESLFVAAPGYLNRVAKRSGALDCQYFDLPALDPATRYVGRVLKLVNLLLIPWCVMRALSTVRKQRIDLLFTVPASTVGIVAYFVHKLARIDLYLYVMDDYDQSMRHQGLAFRLLNQVVSQRKLVQSASKVWAISKYMAEYFSEAYGVQATALPHSVEVDRYAAKAWGGERRGRDSVIRLAHVGAIYGLQSDAVRDVVRMVHHHNRAGTTHRMELRLYIGLTDAGLEKLGIEIGNGVVRDYVTPEKVSEVLQSADILVLAYAFNPQHRQTVSTSLPTKIAEYLASGVPILVHAPPYATISRYVREHNCGVVVDGRDLAALEEVVELLAQDQALRSGLRQNALRTARQFHDARAAIPEFLSHFRAERQPQLGALH